mmetsp:Transcript_31152/g.89386  ORF Transcript_31152/g.89386 Transcript_31152/m.89386 type:complete len:232 (-) Transcript_31152:435-1130(-)
MSAPRGCERQPLLLARSWNSAAPSTGWKRTTGRAAASASGVGCGHGRKLTARLRAQAGRRRHLPQAAVEYQEETLVEAPRPPPRAAVPLVVKAPRAVLQSPICSRLSTGTGSSPSARPPPRRCPPLCGGRPAWRERPPSCRPSGRLTRGAAAVSCSASGRSCAGWPSRTPRPAPRSRRSSRARGPLRPAAARAACQAARPPPPRRSAWPASPAATVFFDAAWRTSSTPSPA